MCLGVKSCECVCVVCAPVCIHVSDFVFVTVSSLSLSLALWRLCQGLLLARSVTFPALCPDMFASINFKYSQTPVMSEASQSSGTETMEAISLLHNQPCFSHKIPCPQAKHFGNELMILTKLRTVLSEDTEQIISFLDKVIINWLHSV